ncbi:hypothetical protein [Fictibacillus sp. NRS-1165]|uniref:hypothetical protein n=1 Tax=Fictibacillus sp. NRS-1165 TaxID=3144463 RepID=UPI003D1DCAB7
MTKAFKMAIFLLIIFLPFIFYFDFTKEAFVYSKTKNSEWYKVNTVSCMDQQNKLHVMTVKDVYDKESSRYRHTNLYYTSSTDMMEHANLNKGPLTIFTKQLMKDEKVTLNKRTSNLVKKNVFENIKSIVKQPEKLCRSTHP